MIRAFVGIVALCAVTLAGCTPVPKDLRDPGAGPLRDADAPIASQVDVTMARLSGDWRVVSSAGTLAPERRFSLRRSGGGWVMAQDGGAALPAQARGQGRFLVLKAEYWVHWMDANGTVALVGLPRDGAVWIMARRNPPPDRIAAAWEIFDWYGYNRTWMRAPE